MFFKKKLLTIIIITIITGCQSYTDENKKFRNEIYSSKYTEASETLNKSSLTNEGRSVVLFEMEKGMLQYLQNDYESAAKTWMKADRKLDELYTVSISKTAASFVINETMTDYTGEAHERVLLPIFTSLSFFANNDQNNSIVMIRRAYDVKKELSANKEGENLFQYDAFSHYFSAMVYESKNEWDNAIVEYRTALNNIQNNNGAVKDNLKNAEMQIYKDLGRLAEFRNRKDLLKDIKSKYPNLTWEKHLNLLNSGEVFIIYESGKSPIKVPKDFVVPTDRTVVRISFPDYRNLQYKSRSADVYLNSQLLGKTIVMEDIGQMAKQALSDRRVHDIAKMAARVVAKDVAARKLQNENPLAGLAANIFNVATEVADTRAWTSLPDTMQVYRVKVPANKEAAIKIKPEYNSPIEFPVTLTKGEKKLYRLRTFN